MVITAAALVHFPAIIFNAQTGETTIRKSTDRQQAKPDVVQLKDLPEPVKEMRDAILAAIQTGNIEDLRTALEWNELSPDLGFDPKSDPIAHWKTVSETGKAYETLATLADLLATSPARLPLGRDLENNDIYVWPSLAEFDPKDLTPAQHVLLYRIVPKSLANEFLKTGKWPWYRIVIGADGTWHAFTRPAKENPTE